MTLEEVRKQCSECMKCRLRKGAKQPVFGEGSLHSQIMFIGEAPGAVEDKLGRPFVGPAGKLLDELLASIGLKRDDVFITNTVKCRPPENRDPMPDETAKCKPCLDAQIELIKPKVFVPLGRFALHYFMPDAVISQEHGKLYERGGKVYFLMYHPAAALHNGGLRPTLFEDIKVLGAFLAGKAKPQSVDDTVSEIMKEKDKLFKDKKPKDGGSDQVGMML